VVLFQLPNQSKFVFLQQGHVCYTQGSLLHFLLRRHSQRKSLYKIAKIEKKRPLNANGRPGWEINLDSDCTTSSAGCDMVRLNI
jgi:hypothetical protein